MDLSDWFTSEQKRIKEFHKNNQSSRNKTSAKEPSPGTIDWIINQSKIIEKELIEKQRENALIYLKEKELAPNEFVTKARLINEKFDRQLEKAGLGKRTIINVKNGKAKTSNRTIKKLQRVFLYPKTFEVDSKAIESALDNIPFQTKGYFCIDHKPLEGDEIELSYTRCDVCKQEIVVNESKYSRAFPNEQGKYLVRKLYDIGVSLQANKQVVLQYDLNYEKYLAKNKKKKLINYKNPPYLKYLICESCLSENKDLPRVFGASYKDMLKKVIDEYPQYNETRLAGLLGINIVTLDRLIKEETNFISHKLALVLTHILLFEKPENLRKSAGIIQAENFTAPKNTLFDDLFQFLYSLGFNFYYGWKDKDHNKFMLVEGSYLDAKSIETKFGANVDEQISTPSLYDVATLLLNTFSKFIGTPLPHQVKSKGIFKIDQFSENGYTNLDNWLEFWKKQSWHNRWDAHPIFKHTPVFLRSLGEELSLDKSIIDEFFCSQAYFNVTKATIKNFTTGSIVLNHKKLIAYKEGLMSTKQIDYICPIMVKFNICPSSKYFSAKKISGPQTMVFFPIRKSNYDLSVDYHHMANVFDASMMCLMNVVTNEDGTESISEYRFFAIKRNKNCQISISIERIESPFSLKDLNW